MMGFISPIIFLSFINDFPDDAISRPNKEFQFGWWYKPSGFYNGNNCSE